MTLELLATIAALCSLPAVGPLFPVKHEQLKCQKAYIKCTVGKGATKYLNRGDILMECILEKQS